MSSQLITPASVANLQCGIGLLDLDLCFLAVKVTVLSTFSFLLSRRLSLLVLLLLLAGEKSGEKSRLIGSDPDGFDGVSRALDLVRLLEAALCLELVFVVVLVDRPLLSF